MNTNIKVEFHSEDYGTCQQLFKTIDKQEGQRSYYARDYGLSWCYVSDPLGYAELEHCVPNDITFIVCDHKGNELFKSSNADENTFPFYKTACQNEWNSFCTKSGQANTHENNEVNFLAHAFSGKQADKLSKWLLTFKDPELYGKDAKDYNENWTMFRTEETGRKVLHTFFYCGAKCEIVEITMRHTICGVEWKEYYSGTDYCGAIFDKDNVGTMYSPSEAEGKVRNMLEEMFGEKKWYITYVGKSNGFLYEKHYKYYQATDSLLSGNFNRKFVDNLIENEKVNPTYFASENEAREAYKDAGDKYIPCYNYAY